MSHLQWSQADRSIDMIVQWLLTSHHHLPVLCPMVGRIPMPWSYTAVADCSVLLRAWAALTRSCSRNWYCSAVAFWDCKPNCLPSPDAVQHIGAGAFPYDDTHTHWRCDWFLLLYLLLPHIGYMVLFNVWKRGRTCTQPRYYWDRFCGKHCYCWEQNLICITSSWHAHSVECFRGWCGITLVWTACIALVHDRTSNPKCETSPELFFSAHLNEINCLR